MPTAEQSTREKKGALCNCNRRMLAITAASLLFLLTIIWSATLWDIARSEKEVQSTVEITTRTLARALSEHMMSTIKRLELAIKELDAAWTPDQKDIRTEAEGLKKIIGDLALQISIVDPDGLVSYSTLPHIAGISIADREHFSVHITPPWREIYVGKPVLGRVSGKWTIQFSSPIIRQDKLVGVIVISVEPDYFASFFRSLGLDEQDSIDVIRSDGTLLVRSTGDGLIYGHIISGTAYLKANSPISGNFRRPSQIDGIERIFGYYKIGQYGLTFVVGSAVGNAFAPFEQIRSATLCAAALVSALLVALAFLAYDSLRRRDEAEKQLELTGQVFDFTGEAICITDSETNILAVNESFCRLTGFSQPEIIGKTPRALASGRHGPEFYKHMWDQLFSNGWWEGEIWNKKKDGTFYLEWLNIKVVRNLRGVITNYIGVFADIKKIAVTQRRIEFLATHDELTQLPNRAVFCDRLQKALDCYPPTSCQFAVAFIDIDDFKIVNDSIGHAAGDSLLKEMAVRLTTAAGADAVVSRFGGDEFTLLLENVDDAKAAATARRIIESLRQPISVCGFEIYAGVSIGIAVYPQHGSDISTLLQNADIAMYHAKGQGKNTFSFFNDELQIKAAIQLQIESGLPRAITENELVLHYQPQVELDSGRIIGLEALVRWQHPNDGLLFPGKFIPQAEKTRLIDKLGEWVADSAAAQIEQWRAAGLNPPKVSINISPSQFLRGAALPMIERILNKYSIPPYLLAIELTESALMTDPKEARRALGKFRDMGLEISIDDFGTGFSSLSSLRHYPINRLKIDQSFVRDLDEAPDACAITQTVIDLAKYLGIASIAEGIENEGQFTKIKMMGCNIGQGFFFAKALSVEELEKRGFVSTGPTIITRDQ
ncbi:MAG TPA: EAL domain-containing protein [Desulfovibrio sp.]|uniref:bifunctional diguanylate cyclase/phosphodiesterase n=1 Tax=Desulfovibrio sp. TaxID=885 RepID=UPI002D57CB94|nr:EAL domain-containing protein [Desulfovibrio sp.]HZF62396.1 EAL domain-containing protein [Desulfovibrio sp.]